MNRKMMDNIHWAGYDWLTQQPWGKYHPDNPIPWYDPNCVEIDDNNILHLLSRRSMKDHGNSVRSEIGHGLIWCKELMGRGYYEIECKLPRGKNLWPAFWLVPENAWPPEIDIFEAYTHDRDHYFDLSFPNIRSLWEVETNFHFSDDGGEHKDLGAKKGRMGLKDPASNFIKYGCYFSQHKVEIFYDGKLVRRTKDLRLLQQLNEHEKFHIIINNGVYGVNKNVDVEEHSGSDLQVKNFKYEKER